MVKSLPKKLTLHFKEVMVLVDTGFGSTQFIHGIRENKYHIIARKCLYAQVNRWALRCSITQTGTATLPSGFEISCLYILVLF